MYMGGHSCRQLTGWLAVIFDKSQNEANRGPAAGSKSVGIGVGNEANSRTSLACSQVLAAPEIAADFVGGAARANVCNLTERTQRGEGAGKGLIQGSR